MIMRMRWRPERAVEDDVEHVVTLMGSFETQGEETSFLPSQPDRWLDIMIMYVTCTIARAAAALHSTFTASLRVSAMEIS
jgi:hypothetical protein